VETAAFKRTVKYPKAKISENTHCLLLSRACSSLACATLMDLHEYSESRCDDLCPFHLYYTDTLQKDVSLPFHHSTGHLTRATGHHKLSWTRRYARLVRVQASYQKHAQCLRPQGRIIDVRSLKRACPKAPLKTYHETHPINHDKRHQLSAKQTSSTMRQLP